ncbi:hypothetical protein PPERSA_07535 [Pseudocohnilembus persalinus]|uniref:Uncharacterized protein n=1 Tax=Pseudocohnilembus persalinus TaxID=266149 RepID=A0A0V0QZS1_PSEPJ|nr:hypothetical protein PPERSA_07535 [Pseudocohnilembus persalinus]|eukprot:KRX07785.1 hypothetical protein PPERSA_07535 [Pseudocohnilembus persalinus]
MQVQQSKQNCDKSYYNENNQSFNTNNSNKSTNAYESGEDQMTQSGQIQKKQKENQNKNIEDSMTQSIPISGFKQAKISCINHAKVQQKDICSNSATTSEESVDQNTNNLQNQQILVKNISSQSQNDDQIFQCPIPDKNNKWVKESLQKHFIRSIFPENYSLEETDKLFALKEGKEPIKIKLSFPTKEEFLQKAEKLHKKKRSKFHNKNKVFFISILKLFKRQYMENIDMPQTLYSKLLDLVKACRVSGRKVVNEKIQKTDLFNHSHYNLLFLTINKESIISMGKNEKDRQIHLKAFGIDLLKQEIVNYRKNQPEEGKLLQEQIEQLNNSNSSKDNNNNCKNKQIAKKQKQRENLYGSDSLLVQEKQRGQVSFWEFIGQINFLKASLYQILLLHLKDQMLGTTEQQSEEREYDYRAFLGILEMVKGINKDRF